MRCPGCGNEYLVPYCDVCETGLIEINGNWYIEKLYQPLLDFFNARENFIKIQTSTRNLVNDATSSTFISDKNNPKYYEILENNMIIPLIKVNNDIKNSYKIFHTTILTENNLELVKTFNTLWGDVESLIKDTIPILEDILENIEYIIIRITEILANDYRAQEIFRRHDIVHMFDDLDYITINNSYSRRLDL